MSLNDFEVFQEYMYTTYSEVVTQQVQLFNEASQGALALRSVGHMGDFSTEAFWALIPGLVKRRNPYGTSTQTTLPLEQLLKVSVKVAAGTPPVDISPSAFKWIQKSPEEGGAVYGMQLAKATVQDMVNTGLAAYVAASLGQAPITTTATGGPASLVALNTAASKMGDYAGNIACWAMHSTTAFGIYGQALANAEKLFVFGTVQVRQDGFGRPFIVSDSPAFVKAGSPVHYYTLGMVPGAVLVEQNEDFTQNISTLNGGENIARTIQSEWSYNLGLRGYSWDIVSGGKAPTNSALATTANWDSNVTSFKDLAGVILETL